MNPNLHLRHPSNSMAFSPICSPPSRISPSIFFPFKTFPKLFPKLPFHPPRNTFRILSSSFSHPQSPFTSEQGVLNSIADSDSAENSLPAVRIYENGLARLSLIGAVEFQQAITAAAADGGEAADEHIAAGMDAMVVETLFPGPVDEESTVSTRLFLPARKVKEKAIKLKKSLTKDILSSTTSKNILAMTFKQVVLQQLWNFELEFFSPRTERDMNNLENPREVPAFVTLSSSCEPVISAIAEVICLAVLESTQRNFLDDMTNRASNKFFHWFDKRKEIFSGDSSVVMYSLLEHDLVSNGIILLEKFNSERGKLKLKTRLKSGCWTSRAFSKLEKIGGPKFCAWISECVPAYSLKVDATKFSDVKFEGWKKSETGSWEVILTHSQMVSLADILDMYYEDLFTLPSKGLACSSTAKSSNLVLNKGNSMLKILSTAVASGIFLAAMGIFGKLYMPNIKRHAEESPPLHSSDAHFTLHHSVESFKLGAYGVSIIGSIKDIFGWPGEVKNSGSFAWIGELPKYWNDVDDIESYIFDLSTTSTSKASQDIAIYQVSLSIEGNIIGFQPTNEVALSNWAANPFAKELNGGKDLSPGLLEPGVQINDPSDVVVLELLMSLNPESYFALIRPLSGGDK